MKRILKYIKKVIIAFLIVIHPFNIGIIKGSEEVDNIIASSIEVSPVKPNKGDLQRIEKLKQLKIKSENQIPDSTKQCIYVVKIYIDLPASAGGPYLLFIGEHNIKEYGGFGKGVFFKIYDIDLLKEYQGKPITFLFNNKTIDLGINFPNSDGLFNENIEELPVIKDVLRD